MPVTLVNLDYTYGYGTNNATDGDKIRTQTDNVTGRKRTYSYDGAGRFSYAKEEKAGSIVDSWQYCYDLAGNLTSQGTDPGCPRGTTSTAPPTRASAPAWATPTSTTALGLSATSTAGVDKGFNREPGGTLNSMTTGGKSYYYLTDAIGSVIGLVDADGNKVDTYAYSPRGVRLLAQSSELKGGAQSTLVGAATGVTETGVGAVAAFATGCAESVAVEAVGD